MHAAERFLDVYFIKILRFTERRVRIKIPAHGVHTIFLNDGERLNDVPLGLAHLLAVLVVHETKTDDVLKGCRIAECGRDSNERVEPPAGLVYAFRDIVRGE